MTSDACAGASRDLGAQTLSAHSDRDTGLLLDVKDLNVSFGGPDGAQVNVLQGLDLSIRPGSSTAIVGESGSGKTVSMRALLRLLPHTASITGSALYNGVDLLSMREKKLRGIRGRDIAMVFQNAMESMNPTLTIQRQLTEHLLWHGICGRREAKDRAIAALEGVGIPEPARRMRMYPHQLSGGMRQRAMIAMAMVTRPSLLIADEPTTAVDVTVQRQILELLQEISRQGTAIIMITHDLGVARYLCAETIVMYAGLVMENAATSALIDHPAHPYSRGLVESALDLGSIGDFRPIKGQPPDLASRPPGCVFQPRCTDAVPPRCDEPQVLDRLTTAWTVRCWKAASLARSME